MSERETPLEFVTGYRCPNCNHQSDGIEVRSGDRRQGWVFQLPVDEVGRILCSNCGADVPRKHWHFQRRER